MLLVMGLATQMIGWHEDFCGELAERGFRVIRFDNRDIGHSTILEDAPVPGQGQMLFGYGTPAYTLTDLADDAAGLLDALELDSAHVVGASMGGMIGADARDRAPRAGPVARLDHVRPGDARDRACRGCARSGR